MAKTRELVRRRKSIANIKKITRTMELIATARFKKAMDRASEAAAFTRKIAELAADLSASATDVKHPLLELRPARLVECIRLVCFATFPVARHRKWEHCSHSSRYDNDPLI